MNVLDRATFDDFAALFDAEELRDVLEDWRADTARALAAISEARARGDGAQIGEIAHRAAGGGLALGAIAFAGACERLRATAESGEAVRDSEIAAVRTAAEATYAAMRRAAGFV